MEGHEKVSELFDFFVGNVQGGAPGGEPFQNLPELKDRNHLLFGEEADEKASPGYGLDQFFLFQILEGAHQGRAANSEILGKLFLGNLFSGE